MIHPSTLPGFACPIPSTRVGRKESEAAEENATMIVDSHAHIFQHWAAACGHPSREMRRRFIQKVQTRPAAKVFRAHDGEEVTKRLLFREGDNSWAGLRDVDFRVGLYGQLDFTLNGEDYYVQYMPVGMQQIVAPPELMLAQMTYARIDHCILQAGGGYGAMNDYNAFGQRQYPSKFTGVFWSTLDRWRLPVFIETPPIPNYDEASYRKNMEDLWTGSPTSAGCSSWDHRCSTSPAKADGTSPATCWRRTSTTICRSR